MNLGPAITKGFFCQLFVLWGIFGVFDDSWGAPIFFSRANCVNNESITWDWPTSPLKWWRVISTHRRSVGGWTGEEFHRLDTNWSYTTRSAAVHWGEGFSGSFGRGSPWYVYGQHYEFIPGPLGIAGARVIGLSSTNNCNLKDFFPDW